MNDSEPPTPRRRSTTRRVGFVLGIALLCAAAVYLIADPSELRAFADRIAHAPAWAIVLVLIGPLLNWVFVSQCLWALNRRHGEIARTEMLALVGSAWLLNHLPMRPGLVGRIGYHAKVNRIRVRDAVEASVWSLVHAIIANLIGLGLALLLSPEIGIARLALILSSPLAAMLLLSVLAETKSDQLGLMMRALMWRYADLLVWMLRYAAAFAMLGVQITPVQIALITAVSQAAQVIPITGGGLGFREWGVGLAATMSKGTAAIDMRTAVGADVINRIAETIIVIPLGLICTTIVTRRFKSAMDTRREEQASMGPVLPEGEAVRHAQEEHQGGHPGEQ
ncbi:MAG: hypothetical protein R3B67_14235 [Phycisphaerales bacterium]